MPQQTSRRLGLIRAILAGGFVLVLLASPGVAEGRDKNQDLIQASKRGRLKKVVNLLNSDAYGKHGKSYQCEDQGWQNGPEDREK
jgi:hypothetical protein